MIWISTWRLKECLDPAGSPVGCLHFLLFLDGFHWGLDERMRMDGNLFENSAQRKEAFGFLAERAYWQTLTGPSVDAEKVKNRHSMWYRYILYNIFLLKWCIFNLSLTWLRFSLACFFWTELQNKTEVGKRYPNFNCVKWPKLGLNFQTWVVKDCTEIGLSISPNNNPIQILADINLFSLPPIKKLHTVQDLCMFSP